jgi:hypothetical protein
MTMSHASRPSRVLLVTTVPLDADDVSRVLAGTEVPGGEVLVLAPSLNESRVAFWVSDADEAIEDARTVAAQTAQAAEQAESEHDVAAAVGDSDPLIAIGDALSEFPADRIVTVYRSGDDARYREDHLEPAELEREFGLPVYAHELAS